MNNIVVLLSTYNGEKYIKEQLLSILTQDFDGGISVIIRDDGSTDSTCSIIKEIAVSDPRITLIKGANIGCVASFFTLINTVAEAMDEYDYYALSDQDDVWLSDKLQTAVDILNKKNNNIPQLYGSRSTLVTENLKIICDSIPQKREISFYNSIIQNFTAGHTQVMNRKMIECIKDADANKIYVHDAYIMNVAVIRGELTFDNTSHALYRQHKRNELGASRKLLKWLWSHIARIKRGDGARYSGQIRYIYDKFNKYMTEEQCSEMTRFFRSQHKLFFRLRYVLTTKLYRQQPIDNFAFKLLYIFGVYNKKCDVSSQKL